MRPCVAPSSRGKPDDLLDFAVPENMVRRHLTKSQRGMVASRVAKLRAGQPKRNGSIEPINTQHQAAQQLNVSRETVKAGAKGGSM